MNFRFQLSRQAKVRLGLWVLGVIGIFAFVAIFVMNERKAQSESDRMADLSYFHMPRDYQSLSLTWLNEPRSKPVYFCLVSDILRRQVRLHNEGNFIMVSTTTPQRERKAVNVAYHLRDMKSGKRFKQQEPHYTFTPSFEPGGENAQPFRDLDLHIRCPDYEGQFYIDVSPVQEDVGWLEDYAKRGRWAEAQLNVVSEARARIDFKRHKYFAPELPYKSNLSKIGKKSRHAIRSAYRTAVNTLMVSSSEIYRGERNFVVFETNQSDPKVRLREMASIQKALPSLKPKPDAFKNHWFDLFAEEQLASGEVPDWISLDLLRHAVVSGKDSIQSDQELWFILAGLEAVELGLTSADWVREGIGTNSVPRFKHMALALDWLLTSRWDTENGCLWAGHTADWGDVGLTGKDSESSSKISEGYPKVCGIFLQALLWKTLVKINKLAPEVFTESKALSKVGGVQALIDAVRKFTDNILWVGQNGFYKVHAHLEDYNHGHDESDIFALAGNMMAIDSGLPDEKMAKAILKKAIDQQKKYHISTIGAVLLPPYPTTSFQNPIMDEAYEYQNGGQWDWFGCRAVGELFNFNHPEAAEKLVEIARKVERNGGFYQWDTREGIGRGIMHFRAGAAAYVALLNQPKVVKRLGSSPLPNGGDLGI